MRQTNRTGSLAVLPDEVAVEDLVDRRLRREHARRVQEKKAPERAAPAGMRWAARLGVGPAGTFPGRVPWEARPPKHFDSTAAARGLYPWLAGEPLPQRGPVMGREIISGALWCQDPWEQRKLGRVGDAGVFISGVIGSAKSSYAKSLVARHVGFGRPFVVPADIRGEWVPVVRAVDGLVLQVGPGMPDRLNALAMPRKPAAIDEAVWWLVVRTHWQDLLTALAETILPGQRELNPVERTAIELALTEATGWHTASGNLERLRPISLHPIVDLLRNPSADMAAQIGMNQTALQDELRHVGLALRLLTEGSLQGMVDSTEPGHIIDPTRAATVVDISRVQSSDAAIALLMACTQSVMELAFIHQVQQWWTVYDEVWRLARFAALMRRLNGGQRRSRTTGAGTLAIMHRVTDSMLGGEEAQRAMLDMISDCATKIIYRQRADAIDSTLKMVPMTDMVAELLPGLPRGRAIHSVDGEPFVVDHLLPPRPTTPLSSGRALSEWDVIETDQALSDQYRTLAGRNDDELYGDLRG